jgi:hypothetical protein
MGTLVMGLEQAQPPQLLAATPLLATASTGNCLSPSSLQQLVGGRLTAEQQELLGSHVAECPSCQGRVRKLADGLSSLVPSATQPASPLRREGPPAATHHGNRTAGELMPTATKGQLHLVIGMSVLLAILALAVIWIL